MLFILSSIGLTLPINTKPSPNFTIAAARCIMNNLLIHHRFLVSVGACLSKAVILKLIVHRWDYLWMMWRMHILVVHHHGALALKMMWTHTSLVYVLFYDVLDPLAWLPDGSVGWLRICTRGAWTYGILVLMCWYSVATVDFILVLHLLKPLRMANVLARAIKVNALEALVFFSRWHFQGWHLQFSILCCCHTWWLWTYWT